MKSGSSTDILCKFFYKSTFSIFSVIYPNDFSSDTLDCSSSCVSFSPVRWPKSYRNVACLV